MLNNYNIIKLRAEGQSNERKIIDFDRKVSFRINFKVGQALSLKEQN